MLSVVRPSGLCFSWPDSGGSRRSFGVSSPGSMLTLGSQRQRLARESGAL